MLALIFLARQLEHASDARGPLRPLPRAELAPAFESIFEDMVFLHLRRSPTFRPEPGSSSAETRRLWLLSRLGTILSR